MKEEELLELTAYAEYHSNHPIATSIQTAYGKEIELERLGAVKRLLVTVLRRKLTVVQFMPETQS